MSHVIEHVLAAIAQEAADSPRFRGRLLEALAADATNCGLVAPSDARNSGPSRARNRRDKALLDPYAAILLGEDAMRQRLAALTIEQLKDVVSEHALDSSRLALKWRSPDRLIDLIVATVRARIEKGDAFRPDVSTESPVNSREDR